MCSILKKNLAIVAYGMSSSTLGIFDTFLWVMGMYVSPLPYDTGMYVSPLPYGTALN